MKEGCKYKQDLHLVDSVKKKQKKNSRTNCCSKNYEKENQGLEQMKQRQQEKPLHGQYPERVNKADVDKVNTRRWLQTSVLKAETEGFILAAQD